MNGFTSSILTLLLSWLRSFINGAWLLFNSEPGESLLSFFQASWKQIFVIACLACLLVDRLVYFVRWRPYYVWNTKLSRFKRRLKGEKADPQDNFTPAPAGEPQPQDFAPYRPSTPEVSALRSQPFPQGPESDEAEDYTINYAPKFQDLSAYHSPVEPGEDDSPTIRHAPVASWQAPLLEQTIVSSRPRAGYDPFTASGATDAGFSGGSHTYSGEYLRDAQSGFAPQPPPEALYPPVSFAEGEPVHPGIDLKTLQQNIGLAPSGQEASTTAGHSSLLQPMAGFPKKSFIPFYAETSHPEAPRTRNPFAQLAQKARNLVSIHDEDNPPTIRDLQTTVDIRDAFHHPVFPNAAEESGEDE